MHLYGRKFVDQKLKKKADQRSETRDAVLWDVDSVNYQARVKIQGSNEYVIAHFPRNWTSVPHWLKSCNAVRIIHRGGRRGYIELVGEGRAIPSPVSGGAMPTQPALSDGVVSGMALSPAASGLNLIVDSGTYRIDGTVYVFTPTATGSYIIMNDPPPMIMGSGTIMGEIQATITFDAAPAEGYGRYDAAVIGIDGTVDYLKGTASTNPEKPAIPGSHILIGDYVLIVGGQTSISDEDIGEEWTARAPASVTITADDTFAWDSGDNTPEKSITVTIKDQYGWNLDWAAGYSLTLELAKGTGQVWSGDDGYDASSVSHSTTSYTCTLKYQRDQTANPEISPVFLITVDLPYTDLQDVHLMTLLDSGGSEIA